MRWRDASRLLSGGVYVLLTGALYQGGMDRNSIFARLVTGFAVKGAAAMAALYAGHAVWSYVATVFNEVHHVLR